MKICQKCGHRNYHIIMQGLHPRCDFCHEYLKDQSNDCRPISNEALKRLDPFGNLITEPKSLSDELNEKT